MIKLNSEIIDGFVQSLLSSSFDEPTPTPEFHRELWELCCSDSPLVAVAAPRGHAKSTAISLGYVMAMMLFRQAKFCLLVSDTEPQAQMFLGSIKQHLEGNEHLRKFFDIVSLTKNNETDIICELRDGYQFRIIAKGSSQKVRGMNWDNKRPDLIVCDDLENDEIVLNKETRDKFKRWFFGALLPCRSPSGKVRVVGTILHMDSILNRLMPQPWGKFTRHSEDGLKIYEVNPKSAWKAALYRAHDPNFEHLLWPTRWTRESLETERFRLTELGYPELYSQEYLNEPIDDSNAFFKKNDFMAISHTEKDDIQEGKLPLVYYMGVDLAISVKERADYSVFIVIGVDSRNTIYVLDVVRRRLDGMEIVDTLLDLQAKYGLQFVAMENEKIAQSIGPFLKEAMKERNIFPTLLPMKPSGDKKVRARSIQGRMRIGTVKFNKGADWYPTLESEFTKFDRDVHDDQVDALAYLGLALDKMTTAQTLEEIDEDEHQSDLRSFGVSLRMGGRSQVTGY